MRLGIRSFIRVNLILSVNSSDFFHFRVVRVGPLEEGETQQAVPEEDLSAVPEGFHPQIFPQRGCVLLLQLTFDHE